MTTIGYINTYRGIDNPDDILTKMNDLGCDIICQDTYSENEDRIRWRYILEDIEDGDTLILASFSNAVTNLVELTILMRMCVNHNIRLVSLKDRIDTKKEMFPSAAGDLFGLLNVFGIEAYRAARRKKNKDFNPGESLRKMMARHNTMKRDKDVINLYISGESVDTIVKRSGNLGRATVYRILDRYGIVTDRQLGQLSKEPATQVQQSQHRTPQQ